MANRNKIKDIWHNLVMKLTVYPTITFKGEPTQGDTITVGKMKATFKKQK